MDPDYFPIHKDRVPGLTPKMNRVAFASLLLFLAILGAFLTTLHFLVTEQLANHLLERFGPAKILQRYIALQSTDDISGETYIAGLLAALISIPWTALKLVNTYYRAMYEQSMLPSMPPKAILGALGTFIFGFTAIILAFLAPVELLQDRSVGMRTIFFWPVSPLTYSTASLFIGVMFAQIVAFIWHRIMKIEGQ